MSFSRRAGLSLVEVMISMAVLAFVLLAFMSIMWSATELSASTKEASIGAFELQNAIEDAYSVSFGNFVTAPPWTVAANTGPTLGYVYTFPSNPATGRYAALPNELVTFQWTNWDAANVPAHWAEYTISIQWTDHRGKTVRDSLTTRRAQ
jgi:Tfp pilus assembly protein PilV